MTLRSNFLWTALGNTVYLACQWGLLSLVAKLGRSDAHGQTATITGQFSYALAVVTPIFMTSQAQVRQIHITDARDEVSFGDYLGFRLAATLVALAVVAVVLLTSSEAPELRLVIVVLAGAKAVESVADLGHGFLQKHDRMDRVAFSLGLKGLLSLAALGGVLALTRSLAPALAAMGAVWLLVLAVYDVRAVRRLARPGELRPRWRATVLLKILGDAAPLAIASGLGSFGASAPRYFLEAYQGPAAVGLFAAATAPLAIVNFLPAALSQATIARAAVHYQRRARHAFSALALKLTAFNAVVCGGSFLVFWLGGERLLAVLFKPEFRAAAPAMVVLAAAPLVGTVATLGGLVLSAGRMFRLQTVNSVIGIGLVYAGNAVLVPRLGLMGAAWTEMVRQAASVLFLLVVTAWFFARDGAEEGRTTADVPGEPANHAGAVT